MAHRGGQPKNLPQTTEQMLITNEQSKPKKYSRREMIEANKDTISALVGDLANRLEEAERCKERINLRDAEAVKDITLRYIRSCQISGVLPTLAGISLALGVTPSSLSAFCARNPETDTAKWIKMVKDHLGNLLAQAALDNAVAGIPAIFTLKANYGWRDDPEPEVQNNDGQEELTPDAIAAKYQDLPE